MNEKLKGCLWLLITALTAAAADVFVFRAPAFAAAGPVVAKAAKPAAAIGKWIAPIIYIGAFALLANGAMHLDPKREKANEVGVGFITLTAGVMWWPFLIAMSSVQGLGPLTNFVVGLAGMYAFFFIALGIHQIMKIPKKQLGIVAILIAWLTGVYALFFLTKAAPGGGTWVYHFSIALFWFVAMNLAGLFMLGKLKSERLLGWVVTIAALYTFAIPAVLWSMPVGKQGPF